MVGGWWVIVNKDQSRRTCSLFFRRAVEVSARMSNNRSKGVCKGVGMQGTGKARAREENTHTSVVLAFLYTGSVDMIVENLYGRKHC